MSGNINIIFKQLSTLSVKNLYFLMKFGHDFVIEFIGVFS